MNKNLLNKAIKESGLTAAQIAQALGISRATYFRKLSLPVDKLTIKNIKEMCELLKLDGPKAQNIFFDEIISDKRL